jgi:hypothetical protein
MSFGEISSSRVLIVIGVLACFGILTFALTAATLGTVNKRYYDLKHIFNAYASSTKAPPLNAILAESIRIQDVMVHLKELQRISNSNSDTRAIITNGFNQTLDYIRKILANHTNYSVKEDFFNVKQFVLEKNPILKIYNGTTNVSLVYSNDLSVAQFYHVRYSTSLSLSEPVQVIAIDGSGCSDAEWSSIDNLSSKKIALLNRGGCPFREKAALAKKWKMTAILFYNDGLSADRIAPIEVSLAQDTDLPALFLSYTIGKALSEAAKAKPKQITAKIELLVKDLQPSPVGNICADTPTGDATQTIVIGSHSDSVPAGPGINDNGTSFLFLSAFLYAYLSRM